MKLVVLLCFDAPLACSLSGSNILIPSFPENLNLRTSLRVRSEGKGKGKGKVIPVLN
jgi:hypothetical protein